ncbi:MAG: hypothetical protein ACTHLE_22990 [Agriterribacter sp.]
MRTKTAIGPRYVHRYFHAETGACLRESEARKLPGKSVIVETIRVPGKYGNTEARKAIVQEPQVNKLRVILHQIKNTVTAAFTRLKALLHFVHKDKRNGGLFEVKAPLIDGLASPFPFAVSRDVKMANGSPAASDAV